MLFSSHYRFNTKSYLFTLRLLWKSFLDFLSSLTQRFMSSVAKEGISGTFFSIFIKNTILSHNYLSELFSNIFSLFGGTKIKYFQGNVFKGTILGLRHFWQLNAL